MEAHMPLLPQDGQQTLAEFLHDRFKELSEDRDPLRQSDIATAVGFTDSYIGLLHKGRANSAVGKWLGSVAVRFLMAYRFTTQEVRAIAERFGLNNVIEHYDLKDANTPRRVKEGGRKVRFLGIVSAGQFGSAFVDDEVVYEDVPSHVLRHHDPADVFALDVLGDSMVSDDARASVPQGSRVYFHSLLRPNPGDLICVRLEEHDISVLKRYQPGEQFTTLTSFNEKHRPIVVDKETPARIEGVMIGFSATTR
jgi:SOS-response transcriptional repressor LexA